MQSSTANSHLSAIQSIVCTHNCVHYNRCIKKTEGLDIMLGDSDGWHLPLSVMLPGLIGTSWSSELHCGSLGFLRCQLWPYLTASFRWKRLLCGLGVGGWGEELVCCISCSVTTHIESTCPPTLFHTYTHQISCPHLPQSIHVYLTETWMTFLLDET